MATLGAAVCVLFCSSAITRAEPSEQLKELRGRIERLQKQLVETEESRTEAADGLRKSERAISDANRRLFNLTSQSRDAHTALSRLQTQKARIAQTTQSQQALLAKLLYQQYVAGQSEPVRLILNRQDPNETARQMFYLSYVTRARSELIAALRSDLESLDRVAVETQDKSKEIARLRAEEAEQKREMEREKAARAEILQRVSTQVAHQRQAISTLQRNEERLSRLVERLARELAKPPTRTSRLRNDVLPETGGDAAHPFKELKGRLKLPVIGELANRYGSQRQDGGLSWKGLFIAAREGQQVRAVASGRVVFADWLRGFGNLMIVDHGSGYMSLYGNNESLLRQVGDEVKTGDPIASVGATGGNAQSGLYFELRYQGKPFDPLSWVTLK